MGPTHMRTRSSDLGARTACQCNSLEKSFSQGVGASELIRKLCVSAHTWPPRQRKLDTRCRRVPGSSVGAWDSLTTTGSLLPNSTSARTDRSYGSCLRRAVKSVSPLCGILSSVAGWNGPSPASYAWWMRSGEVCRYRLTWLRRLRICFALPPPGQRRFAS